MFQKNNNQANAQKILVIDEGVLDAEVLLADLQADFKVVRLALESDSILQITRALSTYAPVSEINILAHAQPGKISFSNQWLDLALLNNRDGEFINWGKWLTSDAKICIYGCRLASGEIGKAFIQKLGFLTGTKVASSTLPIGNLCTNQNWHLDSFTNPFEVLTPFSKNSMAIYHHMLAPIVTVVDVSKQETSDGLDSSYLDFEIALSEASTNNITLSWLSKKGTGDESDLSANSFGGNNLTIPAGATTAFVNVRINSDTEVEPDESILLELYNLTGAEFAGGGDRLTATGIILNDDGTAESRALLVSDVELIEGDSGTQNAVFTVKLSRPATTDLTFDYQTVNGSATAGSDYTAASGTLTFLAGQTEAIVSVVVAGDTQVEAAENFALLVRPQAGSESAIANGIDGITGQARIIEDDSTTGTLPVLSIRDVSNTETDGGADQNYLNFEIALSEASTNNITLSWLSKKGTGDESDLSANSFGGNNLTIPAGATTAFVNVRINSDTEVEPDESILLELYNLTGAEFAGGGDRLTATGIILNDDGTAESRALLVSDVELIEGDSGTQNAVFTVKLSRPATTDLTFDYQTVDGSATAGSDYTAASGTLTFLAGQTEATVSVAVAGDFDLEADETFTLSFAPNNNVANGGSAIEATATIISDDLQNPPIAIEDAYNVAGNITLSVAAANGVLANDSDVENDPITAELVTNATKGTLSLNPNGSFTYTPNAGATGIDQFTYRAFDGISYSEPTNVEIAVNSGSGFGFAGQLTVPDSLSTCEEGIATFTYTNDTISDQPGLLVFVESELGLLQDPLTGDYTDSLFLLGLGDGVGNIAVGEAGTLEFATKMVAFLGWSETISVSIIDPAETIDWGSQQEALQPLFMPDNTWNQIFANFQAEVGTTAGGMVDVLAENAHFLVNHGATGESAATGLAFELEQAGDFGSLAERGAAGSMGSGWAFIGDIGLDISAEGDVALQGSTDLSTLFSLDADSAAYYVVSSSVGVSVGLTGGTDNSTPPNRPVFTKNIDGSFGTTGGFNGELMRTDTGYQISVSDGTILLFDNSGSLTKAIAPNGQETLPSYDAGGHIIGLSGPNSSSLEIIRETNGKVISLTDANGLTTTLAYSSEGSQLLSVSDAQGTANFTYDVDGNLASITPQGGPTSAFSYDSASRLSAIDVASGGEITNFTYDSLGGYTVADGAGSTAKVSLAPGGYVSSVADGEGNTAELVYDVTGKLVGAQLPDGSAVGFTFDDQGRLIELVDPNGSVLRYTYEGYSTNPASFIDANGATRAFTYDANGQIVDATWPDGTKLQFNYDTNGNLVSYTNRRGDTAEYNYNVRGNLLSESDGTSDAVVYTYDIAGRLVSAINADGTTTISCDDAGRITLIEYPNGNSLTYTYDSAGHRTSMTDQDGNSQLYAYDNVGRLVSLSSNDGKLVDYTYDAAGNLVREDNGNGTATIFSYDAAGRVLQIQNLNAQGNENSHVAYTYDELGQRAAMDSTDGVWSYGYDAAGQLRSANFVSTNPAIVDKSIQYFYDAAGNRTSVIEDGVETIYVTNTLNQYESAGATTFNYDDDGNLVSKTDANGTWNYTYDLENHLRSVTTPAGDVTQHEYDVFGKRSAVVENGVRTDYLVDPFGLGNVVGEFAANGDNIASYAHGIGLVARQGADGSQGFYDMDGLLSVVGVTDASGAQVNQYVYTPFGNELFESEAIVNGFEFNGGLGVYEDSNNLTYMRARFYDDEIGRFISEDPLWLGYDSNNLNTYARNNPVSLIDPNGTLSQSEQDYWDAVKEYWSEKGESYLPPHPDAPPPPLPDWNASDPCTCWDAIAGGSQLTYGIFVSPINLREQAHSLSHNQYFFRVSTGQVKVI